jgi:hypothetical protein
MVLAIAAQGPVTDEARFGGGTRGRQERQAQNSDSAVS